MLLLSSVDFFFKSKINFLMKIFKVHYQSAKPFGSRVPVSPDLGQNYEERLSTDGKSHRLQGKS